MSHAPARSRLSHVALATIAPLLACAPAWAQVAVYADRAAFLALPGVTAQPEWPNAGFIAGGAGAAFHLGDVTLTIAAPSSSFYVGSGNAPGVGPDWTTLVPGNDIAISGPENLNVDFDQPVRAFGFDFAEPTTATVLYNPCLPGCPCANSTFHVVLRRAGAQVGAFDFNRPDDTASFVGVVSDVEFDRAEIREQSGSCDDEYFGRFFTAQCIGATIAVQPAPRSQCPSGSATFAVTPAGTGPFTFQWQIDDPPGSWRSLGNDPGPLPGGGFAFAAPINSPSVTLGVHGRNSVFHVRCIVTGMCGSTTSNAVQLFIDPADVGVAGGLPGRDGVHDNNDFIVFINYFFDQNPLADLGSAGGLLGSDDRFDNNDFISFINLFFNGC